LTLPASAVKRLRAAALSPARAVAPIPGALQVLWERPFDRLCYEVSDADLAQTHRPQYNALLSELIMGTGCTEDELLAHGSKVRGVLFFAEDHLARRGALASLVGTQQHRYRLHPVTPEF
jgi:hypothetical protein